MNYFRACAGFGSFKKDLDDRYALDEVSLKVSCEYLRVCVLSRSLLNNFVV
jgi:hypothetical protein